MQKALDDLLTLLDLEDLEVNIFRARSPQDGSQRVFGGQVLGQALVAAGRTAAPEEIPAHSFHAYFLRPGDPPTPILDQAEVGIKADGWLLYVQESLVAVAGRVFSIGKLFTREGHLVASVVQEGPIRKLWGAAHRPLHSTATRSTRGAAAAALRRSAIALG